MCRAHDIVSLGMRTTPMFMLLDWLLCERQSTTFTYNRQQCHAVSALSPIARSSVGELMTRGVVRQLRHFDGGILAELHT